MTSVSCREDLTWSLDGTAAAQELLAADADNSLPGRAALFMPPVSPGSADLRGPYGLQNPGLVPSQ